MLIIFYFFLINLDTLVSAIINPYSLFSCVRLTWFANRYHSTLDAFRFENYFNLTISKFTIVKYKAKLNTFNFCVCVWYTASVRVSLLHSSFGSLSRLIRKLKLNKSTRGNSAEPRDVAYLRVFNPRKKVFQSTAGANFGTLQSGCNNLNEKKKKKKRKEIIA